MAKGTIASGFISLPHPCLILSATANNVPPQLHPKSSTVFPSKFIGIALIRSSGSLE